MDSLTIMLLCSVAPAMLLLAYARYRDRKHPEPWTMVLKGVGFGVASVAVTICVNTMWQPLPFALGFGWLYEIPMVRGVFKAFYEAALPEEACKLLMLWLLLHKCKYFKDYMDGVFYAICVGMGFAGLENIQYVFLNEENWQSVAITRSIFAVPGHYIFAVIMGFFYSIVHFQPKRFGKYRSMVYVMPVLAHGAYDSICFLAEENMLFALLSYPVLIWFCIKMHKFCFKRLDKMDLLDEDQRDLERFTRAMRNEE